MQLSLPVAQPGKYVLLVEYANTNALQSVGIAVSSPHSATQPGTFTFYPCVYRYGSSRDKGFFAMARTAPPPAELFLVYLINKVMLQCCPSKLCVSRLILARILVAGHPIQGVYLCQHSPLMPLPGDHL